MAWTSFNTTDSNPNFKRCILCDAPVGVKSNGVKLMTFVFMGETYCEYCGSCRCPFCGKENTDLTSSCEATDVFHNPMHYEISVEEETEEN